MPRPLPFRFDSKTGRYSSIVTGRFVTAAQVRRAIDDALVDIARDAKALAEQLRTRSITLDAWRLKMRGIIKDTHIMSAAAAKGGWAQLSPADYGRVGRLVRDEYAFLERFAREIQSGKQVLDGRLTARVELYTEAGRQTFHAVERKAMEDRGMTEERSILGVADHCDGCVFERDRQWVPIGALVPIGQRECGRRCKCFVEFQ